jgi:hypothetical protein
MATYKIISDNTTLGKSGQTVTDADLGGLNVAALVSSGHIEPVSVSSRKQDKKEQD